MIEIAASSRQDVLNVFGLDIVGREIETAMFTCTYISGFDTKGGTSL